LKEKIIKEDEYFASGQPIIRLKGNYTINELFIYLPFNGKLKKIIKKDNNRYSIGDKLFLIERIDDEKIIKEKLLNQEKKRLDQIELGIEEDKFTDEKTINF